MKHLNRLAIIATALLMTTSCEQMMDTDSTSVIVDKGQLLDSPNDSLYSAMGILAQVRNLGERYVLLGELRGDLMTASDNASESLSEIAKLNMTADNDYADMKDYYNVVNNCNYALARMDTTVTIYQSRVLVPEYAAIKTMRDWTYWQMALAYGEVSWIEQPLLSVDEALASPATINMEEVAKNIIDDLTPFVNTKALNYGTIDGYDSQKMFYPTKLLVADLYLYLNQYHEAARYYYEYIHDHSLVISSDYANNWRRDNRSSIDLRHTDSYLGEMLCGMMYSSDSREERPLLIRWTYHETPCLLPATSFVNDMTHAMHFYAEDGALSVGSYLEGDLRGQAVGSGDSITASSMDTRMLGAKKMTRVYKYLLGASRNESGCDPENTAVGSLYVQRMLPLVRVPHVYLRFAEAVNRLGMPSVAFAVLKYGLTEETLANAARVSPWELEKGKDLLDFSWLSGSNATNVVGTAARGRGRGISLDTEHYVISANCQNLADSITAVEDCIVDEMAAETAFEGNRFFDLLRVARHRDAFPAYMAEKISAKFDDANATKTRLQSTDVWFMQRKKQ